MIRALSILLMTFMTLTGQTTALADTPAEQAYWTIYRPIERMVEQNHDQKFSYDRKELIEMLDAALAKQ